MHVVLEEFILGDIPINDCSVAYPVGQYYGPVELLQYDGDEDVLLLQGLINVVDCDCDGVVLLTAAT